MKVSVWVGCAPSWEALDECLSFVFTGDGDAIPGPFGAAFGIERFNEDFREAGVHETTSTSATDLISKHSGGKAIASALGSLCSLAKPCNAVALHYDFEYSGQVRSAKMEEVTLQFLGCVEISKKDLYGQ